MGHLSLVTTIIILLIFGAITAAIGQRKNLPLGGSFALGALLGIIGLIIVIFQKPGLPTAPPGMRAVKCSRCNTIQNIPETQPEYECWQCKGVHRLWGAPDTPQKSTTAARSSEAKTPQKSTKVKCSKCQHVQAVPVSQAKFACAECGAKLKRKTQPAEHS
jgi:DNA-directed RNA polymerase subunit RPC12/RpoP